jgi:hypothetical protein
MSSVKALSGAPAGALERFDVGIDIGSSANPISPMPHHYGAPDVGADSILDQPNKSGHLAHHLTFMRATFIF